MRYPKYPRMKDSGVEWLGEVPEGWGLVPMKRVVLDVSRGISPDYVDVSDIKVLNQACIYWDGLKLENVKYQNPCKGNWQKAKVKCGDVLINSTGTGTLGRVAMFNIEGSYVTDSHITRVRPQIYMSGYLRYLLSSSVYQDFINRVISSGATNQVELSKSGLQSMYVPVPNRHEISAIASFLDRETAKLDALIAKKQRLIALLQEKRQALISHVVTKGLDPDVPMKDSGVEWLGEVPEGWRVIPYKRLVSKITSGSRGWAQYYSEDGPLFVRITNLTRDSIDLDLSDCRYVRPPEGAEGSRTEVHPGDVLLSITADIGSVAVVPYLGMTGYVNQHIALTRPDNTQVLPRWLGYVLRSNFGQNQVSQLLYGGTKDGLSLDDVANIAVPLPSLAEQAALIDYLEIELGRFGRLINAIKIQIELLQEYRQALISAAVTGKIDVRGEV